MRSSPLSVRRLAVAAIVWTAVVAAVSAQSAAAAYAPKNGILNWKAILLGGGFRVTPTVPLHGNFAKYDRVEIVRSESLIGRDVPASVLDELTTGLAAEFRKGGHLASAGVVDRADLPATPPAAASTPAPSFRDADPLAAPMRTWDDLAAFDRQRREAASADTPGGTLVVESQVIDYAPGNKLLQLLFLDLGNAVLTVRVSYFDKATGERLGASIISSDNSSSVIPSAFSLRTAVTGVVGGLVDQVTRRKVAAER